MDVTDALKTRMTCRAFLDKPVSKSILLQILEGARWTPSGGNLQPWHVYAIMGSRLNEFLEHIAERQKITPEGETAEYRIFPEKLTEPYRSRRFKCGEDMFTAIDVDRGNKLGRKQ